MFRITSIRIPYLTRYDCTTIQGYKERLGNRDCHIAPSASENRGNMYGRNHIITYHICSVGSVRQAPSIYAIERDKAMGYWISTLDGTGTVSVRVLNMYQHKSDSDIRYSNNSIHRF
jgi:hypothetical protein